MLVPAPASMTTMVPVMVSPRQIAPLQPEKQALPEAVRRSRKKQIVLSQEQHKELETKAHLLDMLL
jgi:hypothetical protein